MIGCDGKSCTSLISLPTVKIVGSSRKTGAGHTAPPRRVIGPLCRMPVKQLKRITRLRCSEPSADEVASAVQ